MPTFRLSRRSLISAAADLDGKQIFKADLPPAA